jgi:hypothetical protein
VRYGRFISEKPRVIPWPERLFDHARFEMTLGELGGDDYHVTIGDDIEETLERLAGIVARDRVYDAHHARSWSE